MDFETSCWSTGSLTKSVAPFHSYDNPVQRRPKVDYFDSTSITPIVSHISSNGYYGYCPTTYIPSTIVDVHSENSPRKVSNDFNETCDSPMESVTLSPSPPFSLPNSDQMKYQGRCVIENRKRAVQCVADEFGIEHDAKRRRSHLSVIDYVEDMQMSYDDAKDVTYNASNIETKQLYVCIKQNQIGQMTLDFDLNETSCDSATNRIQTNLNESVHNTDANKNNSTASNDSHINDMENLFWHTHGSMLWQR